mmetsp:Transcript_10932/g.22431  ORF Transcript_10932/g.22431 Transcript_10932/m.22431 type:complete len:80 (+) Transcript_10932:2149-2388(+)
MSCKISAVYCSKVYTVIRLLAPVVYHTDKNSFAKAFHSPSDMGGCLQPRKKYQNNSTHSSSPKFLNHQVCKSSTTRGGK